MINPRGSPINICRLEQEADLIRKHKEDETRCADRPQHLKLLQAANKREFEVEFSFQNSVQSNFLGVCKTRRR